MERIDRPVIRLHHGKRYILVAEGTVGNICKSCVFDRASYTCKLASTGSNMILLCTGEGNYRKSWRLLGGR